MNQKVLNPKRLLYVFLRILGFLVAPIIILFLAINLIGSLLLTSPLIKNDLGGIGIYNPYELSIVSPKSEYSKLLPWKKIALHIHSNEVWYTPERQSLKDLTKSYQRNGFEWISISDYNLVTDYRNWNAKTFLSYEWSSSLLKRHFLFVGVKTAILDPFYFFSTRENIQWIIDQHRKRDAFIVSNHPTLYDSMPIEFLANLSGVHAVEIFSPFGDDPKIMDKLLEHRKPIFAMAADDLHYLPLEESRLNHESDLIEFWKKISFVYGREGQAFQRFILMPNFIDSEEQIYQALCQGNYVSVRKFDRRTEDFSLRYVKFENNTLEIAFNEKVNEIRFITSSSEPTLIVRNVSSAKYNIKEKDSYVRAEIIDWNGILTTNPVYRTESMEQRPTCKTKI
jgi:hypothetical protein